MNHDPTLTASDFFNSLLSEIERGGTMTVGGNMPDGTINQRVAIDAVPSTFGGWRCYFICPITARRCEILYYARGRFASREAQRLSYAVQGLNDLSRARRKAAKLRHRLYGPGPLSRPRGRNRIDMVRRLNQAEVEQKALYLHCLRDLADRSGARRMPCERR